MERTTRILDGLTRIVERADVFRHGREEVFADLNLTEVHCIHWIGSLDHANVTKIAERMGMTRGAISKIARKLLGKELVASYREPTNNKEIYFRLLPGGRRMYDEHGKCHTQARAARMAVLEGYDVDEQAVILRFLDDMNRLIDIKLSLEKGALLDAAAQPGEDEAGR